MGESRHTPGPWTAWKNNSDVFAGEATHNEPARISGVGPRVASCEDDGIPPYQQVANARLIAAAPDFYSACRGLVNYMDDPRGSEKGGTPLDGLLTWLPSIRAAIAKAEGTT